MEGTLGGLYTPGDGHTDPYSLTMVSWHTLWLIDGFPVKQLTVHCVFLSYSHTSIKTKMCGEIRRLDNTQTM